MLKRGIPLAAAGDNCRDSFGVHGDHDVLDTFRQSVRILHLDHPVTDAPSLVAATLRRASGASSIMACCVGARRPGLSSLMRAPINEIISAGRTPTASSAAHGEKLDANVPDYSELWPSEGPAKQNLPA